MATTNDTALRVDLSPAARKLAELEALSTTLPFERICSDIAACDGAVDLILAEEDIENTHQIREQWTELGVRHQWAARKLIGLLQGENDAIAAAEEETTDAEPDRTKAELEAENSLRAFLAATVWLRGCDSQDELAERGHSLACIMAAKAEDADTDDEPTLPLSVEDCRAVLRFVQCREALEPGLVELAGGASEAVAKRFGGNPGYGLCILLRHVERELGKVHKAGDTAPPATAAPPNSNGTPRGASAARAEDLDELDNLQDLVAEIEQLAKDGRDSDDPAMILQIVERLAREAAGLTGGELGFKLEEGLRARGAA